MMATRAKSNKRVSSKEKLGTTSKFKASLSNRCDLGALDLIREKLDEENLDRFVAMCFGQFMQMWGIHFQAQLILNLLLRMDWASSEGRLVFRFGKWNAVFGPTEFFLITGLPFGPEPSVPSSSTLHSDLFGGRNTIRVVDIEKVFKDICGENGGKGPTALRLALLLFLYSVLLMRDKSSKKIDMQYFHVVEDFNLFNSFPWGTVAFNFILSSIKEKFQGYIGPNKTKLGTGRANIDCCGFAYALQVWAYEAIPRVASRCATSVIDGDDKWPRFLRWLSNGSISSYEISKLIEAEIGQVDVLSRLVASDVESSHPVFLLLQQFEAEPKDDHPIGQNKRPRLGAYIGEENESFRDRADGDCNCCCHSKFDERLQKVELMFTKILNILEGSPEVGKESSPPPDAKISPVRDAGSPLVQDFDDNNKRPRNTPKVEEASSDVKSAAYVLWSIKFSAEIR
ncbi:hypothetical protein C2S52_002481 [Perilla frutescens var. hirtella]|nr:hypothetical protein C2S52_002481 [Perilla frutescens var. hirtella]